MTNSTEQLNDPAYWRQRAEEARRTAAQISDAEQKKTLLAIADRYDQLATLTEKAHP